MAFRARRFSQKLLFFSNGKLEEPIDDVHSTAAALLVARARASASLSKNIVDAASLVVQRTMELKRALRKV